MDLSQVNYIAVLVAAIVFVIEGALWYSPALFGNKWMKLVGMKKEDIKKEEANKAMFGSFITALVTAFVMAVLITNLGITTLSGGALLGFWVFLGFTATSTMTGVLYEKKKPEVYYLHSGYFLVGYILVGAILAVWG